MTKAIVFLINAIFSAIAQAETSVDTTTVAFSGFRFEVPSGVQVIASASREAEEMLILKYSKEKGKRYIGFWNETNAPELKHIKCDISDFYDQVFSDEKSDCDVEFVDQFKREFVCGYESGILNKGDVKYYYSVGKEIVNVFFVSEGKKVIHIDSDFMKKETLVDILQAVQ